VTDGTTVRALVSNGLSETLYVRGLYTRPGTGDATAPARITPGETREITFLAGAPGTYYYWASTDPAAPLESRKGHDTQLSGALVVDAAGARPPDDRVLVITGWTNDRDFADAQRVFRFAVNGRSWPHTERLSYRVGDEVRMRLANAGGGVHPMHLHGFYFAVEGGGTESTHTLLPGTAPPRLVVTERMASGSTFALRWTPTRPGNWLFHCHDNVHIEHGGPLDGSAKPPPGAHRHVENHALEMMAGPVMGITVDGASAEAPEPDGPRRDLRLVARLDEGSTEQEPAFAYTLERGAHPAVPPGSSAVGPPIVLKRGEPVTITVVNRLQEPTAVHWHGIELESYYDGVPGFSGLGSRIAPPIRPGESFEAHFTPPRAGTFMYHTHADEVRQAQAGLSGALLVLDDPATYDPDHDIVLLVTVPRGEADAARVLINGALTPPTRSMKVGARYRLRLINLHTFRPAMRLKLMDGDSHVTWKAVAKDGMDLPPERVVDMRAEIQMGNGEAYDYEFVPTRPGALRFEVTSGAGGLLATMPIEVR
jgi:manganese oxidase